MRRLLGGGEGRGRSRASPSPAADFRRRLCPDQNTLTHTQHALPPPPRHSRTRRALPVLPRQSRGSLSFPPFPVLLLLPLPPFCPAAPIVAEPHSAQGVPCLPPLPSSWGKSPWERPARLSFSTYGAGGEALGWVVQRGSGCPIHGSSRPGWVGR